MAIRWGDIMKLGFFDREGKCYFMAVVWNYDGDGEEEYYTTLREARAALKRLRKKRPECTDGYIRQYDEDGWGVRDYNE